MTCRSPWGSVRRLPSGPNLARRSSEGPKPGASTAAKAYRLLRSILATAVEDDLLSKNPCAIKGAGVEHPKERSIATIEQVYALADAIEPRHRALVLTATFTGLRLGELRALTRRRLDLLHATVHVVEQMSELKHGELVVGPPKSDAGKRTVAIPPALIPELEAHIGRWSGPRPDGLVFWAPGTSPSGERACTRPGVELCAPSASTGSASTISDTPATRSRRAQAQAPRSSWFAWATPRPEPPSSTSTPPQERDQAIAQALSDPIARSSPPSAARIVRLPCATPTKGP